MVIIIIIMSALLLQPELCTGSRSSDTINENNNYYNYGHHCGHAGATLATGPNSQSAISQMCCSHNQALYTLNIVRSRARYRPCGQTVYLVVARI